MKLIKTLTATCLSAGISLIAYGQSEVENLGKGVNSFANERNPVVSPDGKFLYFTRQNHPGNVGGKSDAGDIWVSSLQSDGSWSEAVNAGKSINNPQPNYVMGFSPDGGTIYLSGHYDPEGAKLNTQGVSMATGSGSDWSFPKAVEIPYFYTKSDHVSGCLHTSGNIMLVTLQSYDTRGAEDLYVLFKKSDGSWTEPKNLGSTINTNYQEMTPFLAPDGKTLYFASNGYEGFGSRDIFKSVRLDDSWKKWSKPENLGASVNSEGTELSYSIPEDGDFAFLSTTQNSDGLGDIARIRIKEDEIEEQQADTFDVIAVEEPLPVEEDSVETETAQIEEEVLTDVEEPVEEEEESIPMLSISGTVTNQKNQEPVTASIEVIPLGTDSTTNQQQVQVGEDGSFSIEAPANINYELMVTAEGFIRKRERVLGNEGNSFNRNITLTPIEVGSTVKLENVLFDRGTADMLPGGEENLNEVVTFMEENPNVQIEVAGHTDNQGRADLNLLLSKDRAQAVKVYLVNQGISPSRIDDKGYGGTRPIASNAIEEERQKNRRVEFTIIKK